MSWDYAAVAVLNTDVFVDVDVVGVVAFVVDDVVVVAFVVVVVVVVFGVDDVVVVVAFVVDGVVETCLGHPWNHGCLQYLFPKPVALLSVNRCQIPQSWP